jgi:peptidoglycan hydrolase-like protein with peptidoglycan-binding domain
MELGWKYKKDSDLQIACTRAGEKNTKEGIRWIQTTLNHYFQTIGYTGYLIPVNGTYDKTTETAVKRFQKLAGLDVDGDAGFQTIHTLLYDQIASKVEKKSLASYLNLPKTPPSGAKADEKAAEETNADEAKAQSPLKLVKKSYKVKVGAKPFRIRTTGGNGKKITYKSSKKKVATVSKKGVVRVKKAGKAGITVKQGKTRLKVKVTVKKKN